MCVCVCVYIYIYIYIYIYNLNLKQKCFVDNMGSQNVFTHWMHHVRTLITGLKGVQ